VFLIFHRAWVLIFESSLLAVDPKIIGLPYWDFSIDMRYDRGDTSVATVFSDKYFGSDGDPTAEYVVTDGPFAYWPICNDTSKFGLSFSSPYGLLRSPVSVNRAPFLTRRLGSLCGVHFQLGNPDAYTICQETISNPDMEAFRTCIDPTIHGPAHLYIGGSWKRDSQLGQPDSLNCAQWIGQIRPQYNNRTSEPVIPKSLGSFINAYSADCFECPDESNKCGLYENSDSCVCIRKDPRPRSCGPLWTNLDPSNPDSKTTLAPCNEQQIIGDFVDAACSPNEIAFALHHNNIDRVATNWMSTFEPEPLDVLEYFSYPEAGFSLGSNLDDELNPTWKMFSVIPGYFDEDPWNPRPWTVRDVIEATYPKAKLPYTYIQDQYPKISKKTVSPTRKPSKKTRPIKQGSNVELISSQELNAESLDSGATVETGAWKMKKHQADSGNADYDRNLRSAPVASSSSVQERTESELIATQMTKVLFPGLILYTILFGFLVGFAYLLQKNWLTPLSRPNTTITPTSKLPLVPSQLERTSSANRT